MLSQHFHKTRIAPTPSGFLHLGNAYSFLLTADLAKKTGAKILLRIDDLDTERTRAQYVQDIFDSLEFLQIEYDEGPCDYGEYRTAYSQLHRGELYEAALQELADRRLVYACNCSRTALENKECNCAGKNIALNEADTAWRLYTDETKEIIVHTFESGIIKTTLPAGMKNFIVRKKDGRPSYQLASLVDDVHYKTDLIVRGEDLWASTFAQLYLAEKLQISSFGKAVFHHHILLTDQNGKLSKSAGALSIQQLRAGGKKREDIVRMIEKAGKRA